jgi:hypothetical protein
MPESKAARMLSSLAAKRREQTRDYASILVFGDMVFTAHRSKPHLSLLSACGPQWQALHFKAARSS